MLHEEVHLILVCNKCNIITEMNSTDKINYSLIFKLSHNYNNETSISMTTESQE